MSLFFGDNNYCYVPYNAALNTLTNAISICTWVHLTQSQSLQMFINRATGSTAGSMAGNEWWSLNLSGMAPRALIGDAASVTNVRAPSALSLNTWYHLAFTYNGSSILLYQNGVVVASGTRNMTFGTDTTGIVVGQMPKVQETRTSRSLLKGILRTCDCITGFFQAMRYLRSSAVGLRTT